MKKINFKIELKDAFGQLVLIKDEKECLKPVFIHEELVNIISHPKSLPEQAQTQMQVINRLRLSMKIAEGKEADFNDDELSIIRESTMNLYSQKMLTLMLAGTILTLIETK